MKLRGDHPRHASNRVPPLGRLLPDLGQHGPVVRLVVMGTVWPYWVTNMSTGTLLARVTGRRSSARSRTSAVRVSIRGFWIPGWSAGGAGSSLTWGFYAQAGMLLRVVQSDTLVPEPASESLGITNRGRLRNCRPCRGVARNYRGTTAPPAPATEQLIAPTAVPGRDRPGWKQPTAVPNLQGAAARRESRRCIPTRRRHPEQTLGRASRSLC